MELVLKQNYFDWVKPKKITKEEKIKVISTNVANQLFNDKHFKENLTSEEIALVMLSLKEEVKSRLVLHKENHEQELKELTKYHTFEMEEADKAYNRL